MDLCAKSSIKGGLAIIQQHTIRARSNKFFDHFSQAVLFWRSQSEPEQEYGCRHCNFELGKVEIESIRKRKVACLLGSIVSWPRRADRGGFQPP
jgi:catalase